MKDKGKNPGRIRVSFGAPSGPLGSSSTWCRFCGRANVKHMSLCHGGSWVGKSESFKNVISSSKLKEMRSEWEETWRSDVQVLKNHKLYPHHLLNNCINTLNKTMMLHILCRNLTEGTFLLYQSSISWLTVMRRLSSARWCCWSVAAAQTAAPTTRHSSVFVLLIHTLFWASASCVYHDNLFTSQTTNSRFLITCCCCRMRSNWCSIMGIMEARLHWKV